LNITVQPLEGFNTPVSLNVKEAPGGVTVNFNPSSGTPSFTVRTDVDVGRNVAPGTYPLTITAKGSAEKDVQVTLSVEAPKKEPSAEFPYALLTLIIILILLAALLFFIRRRKVKPQRKRAGRFCIECGKDIPSDVTHCPKCGAKQK